MLMKNLSYIRTSSLPYRRRFGNLNGLLLWLKLRRDYKLPKGTVYGIKPANHHHEIFLRAGTSDLLVFQQIFCDGETEFDIDRHEPHFILDAGANIGLSSIMFAKRWPNAKIVSLEVDRANYELLCKNVVKYPNVTPVNKALWRTDGYVKISNVEAEPWAFQVIETSSDDPGAIEAVSLDKILESSGQEDFGLLKIDIEGAELDLLQSSTADWVNKTMVMAIELHDRFRPGCTTALDRAISKRPHTESAKGEYRIIKFI